MRQWRQRRRNFPSQTGREAEGQSSRRSQSTEWNKRHNGPLNGIWRTLRPVPAAEGRGLARQEARWPSRQDGGCSDEPPFPQPLPQGDAALSPSGRQAAKRFGTWKWITAFWLPAAASKCNIICAQFNLISVTPSTSQRKMLHFSWKK